MPYLYPDPPKALIIRRGHRIADSMVTFLCLIHRHVVFYWLQLDAVNSLKHNIIIRNKTWLLLVGSLIVSGKTARYEDSGEKH
jgi:hypothetical protein